MVWHHTGSLPGSDYEIFNPQYSQLEKTEKLKSFSYVEKFEVSKIPFKLENTNRSLKVFNAE